MLDGMASSLASRPASKAASDWCTGPSFMNTSVLPVHTITRRSQLFLALKFRMSAMSCSARSRLFLPFFTFGPLRRFT